MKNGIKYENLGGKMKSNKGFIIIFLMIMIFSLFAQDITLSMEAKKNLRSANMYFLQKNFEKAHTFYNKLLEEDGNYLNGFDLVELSNYTFLVYDIDKDYKKSYHLAGEVIEKCDRIVEKYESLKVSNAKSAKKFHKDNIAKQNLENVLGNNQKIKQSSWVRMLQAAQKKLEDDQFEEAIASLNELYTLTPDSTVIIKLIAVSYKENNEPDKASVYFKKIIDKNPSDVVAINQLASHHYAHKEFDEAAKWYQKAAKYEPENENHYFNAAICYSNSDNKQQAYEMFKKSAEVNPQYLDAIVNASVMAHNLGLEDERIEFLKRAIDINPKDKDIIMQITYAFNHNKDYNNVIKYATMWKDIEPDSEIADNLLKFSKQILGQKKK
jgi:tetratricopeptide (TPR) repeat protein